MVAFRVSSTSNMIFWVPYYRMLMALFLTCLAFSIMLHLACAVIIQKCVICVVPLQFLHEFLLHKKLPVQILITTLLFATCPYSKYYKVAEYKNMICCSIISCYITVLHCCEVLYSHRTFLTQLLFVFFFMCCFVFAEILMKPICSCHDHL